MYVNKIMSFDKKRNLSEMEESNSRYKKRQRPRLKLENVPPINSIKDLIEVGRSIKFYKNMNTIMLWKITPYLEELDKMVGMETLKETVFFQIVYYLQGMHLRNKDDEYLHTIITGAPGTGKTSVAKIIGKIYQAMGILSASGPFKIAYRDDFIAEYLGQTAIKTRKLLKSCIGGVLFIDEVYSLAPHKSDRDSFSSEALDVLTAFLSEHKNDFCCIAAGYEKDIKQRFFAKNEGLERRFTWIHNIEEYSPDNLTEIMMLKIKDMNWDTSFKREEMVKLIKNNKDYFKNAGGDIETFLTKCKMLHSRRVLSLGSEHKFVLTVGDLNETMEYLKKTNKKEKDEPPMHMYM